MQVSKFPGCCTSAVLYSFGEHGEESDVTVDNIKKLVAAHSKPVYGHDGGGLYLADNPKLCIFATTVPEVNPGNIETLKSAGFKEVATYQGVQGKVHVMLYSETLEITG